jgi:hypothetical protein
VQAIFTTPHGDDVWHGVDEFVERSGGIVLPWSQAVREHWDLVLTASHRNLSQVHGPILILPHGAGALKSLRRSRKAGNPTRDATGLDQELLTYRGRLLPAALALTHELELAALRHTCPDAVPVAVLAGDLCLDRMVASIPYRDRYREALGVTADQELIVVSSTWTPESTFGRHPELYQRVLAEAGEHTQVAAVFHPMVLAAHGVRQVHSWLAAARELGMRVIPSDEGWRATMIAADRVIGDFGSTTSYAAAIGRPVHLAAFPDLAMRAGSVAATLATIASRLDHDRPLLPQLRIASEHRNHQPLTQLISSRPGEAARILRSTMYRLLNLEEPTWPAASAVLPCPVPTSDHV